MKNWFYLCLVCISTATHAGNTNTSTSSSTTIVQAPKRAWTVFSGTIQNNLRTEHDSSKKNLDLLLFPQPGQIQFTTPLYCGDGDVANYYSENTNEEYYGKVSGQNSVKLVMGYWVNQGGASSQMNTVPNVQNWFSMGQIDLAEKSAGSKLILSNTNNSPVEASNIVQNEMTALLKQIQNSSLSSSNQFTLHIAAMICNEFESRDGVITAYTQSHKTTAADGTETTTTTTIPAGSPGPTAATIAAKLIELKNSISTTSAIEPQIDPDGSLNLITSSGALTTNRYLTLANAIKSFSYPRPPAPSANSSNSGNSSNNVNNGSASTASTNSASLPPADAKISTIRNLIQTKYEEVNSLISGCNTSLSSGGIIYWWESVPLQLTCQKITSGTLANANSALYGGSASGDSTMSESAFISKRDALASLLTQISILEAAQEKLKNMATSSLPRNKTRCFPTSGDYILKVLSSQGVPLSIAASTNRIVTSEIGGNPHPEGGYAVGQYSTYRGNDLPTVFMNSQSSGLGVELNSKSNYTFGVEGALVFTFNLRGIGCANGVGYCYNF